MISINIFNSIGILIIILLIVGVGIYSGTRVHNAKDFTSGGHSAGVTIVMGAILGALIGGQSTIGTAQMGFLLGLSAWWFTIGCGIGCLILFLVYVVPMRNTGKTTILSVICQEYGHRAEHLGAILSSIGIVVSIISNVISGCALMMTILDIHMWTAAIITVSLMIIYVIFGGVWGAGMGGMVKLILLYGVSVVGLILVLSTTGGVGGLLESLDHTLLNTGLGDLYEVTTASLVRARYMNLLSQGIPESLSSVLSLTLGVLSTQTYAQAIWAAKDNREARKGAIFSGLLCPPVGFCCLMIGMYMRNHCITLEEVQALTKLGLSVPENLTVIKSSAQVFPMFILQNMPGVLGGIALGGLIITVVAGGAGLALGVSSILTENILFQLIPEKYTKNRKLLINRLTIILLMGGAAVLAVMFSGTLINNLGFLSMGLRGTVVFLPFTCALFFKDKISSAAICILVILAPLSVIATKMSGSPVDPLWIGIGVGILCCILGHRLNHF